MLKLNRSNILRKKKDLVSKVEGPLRSNNRVRIKLSITGRNDDLYMSFNYSILT